MREQIESFSNKLKYSDSLLKLTDFNDELDSLARALEPNLLSNYIERLDKSIFTLKQKTISELLQLQDLDVTVSSITSNCYTLQEFTHAPSFPLKATLSAAAKYEYSGELAKPIPIVPFDQILKVS